jgi:DNA/RNA-binding domain of Phe-tRNA-synthetase-like protein
VAVFDVAKIIEHIEVRHASGAELYAAFSGEVENPEPGEVIFGDKGGRAHARRWTHRQSAYSAVGPQTIAALIVAEGVHSSAPQDIERLTKTIADETRNVWASIVTRAVLSRPLPRFEF